MEYEHGQRKTYTVHGCRCDECSEVNAAYCREWSAKKKALIALGHPEGRKPSASIYRNWGCRCDECREAQRIYVAEKDRRKP